MKYLEEVDYVYGPYVYSNNGRKSVNVHLKNGRKRFVSYPKFLVEVVLGRALDPTEETVDHINGDFNDNAWSNLRVINKRAHAVDDSLRVRVVEIQCVWCGAHMHRRPKEIDGGAKRSTAGPFCTNRCVGKYTTARQSNNLPHPVSHYDQWSKYTNAGTKYYTLTKGGETVADVAERLGIDLPTEDEVAAALPRRKLVRRPKPIRPCIVCGRSTKNKKYCSSACCDKARCKVQRPSPEELKRLVWERPTLQLAKQFEVSDVAIAKWCKRYGIDKPPRGYWAKQRAKNKDT